MTNDHLSANEQQPCADMRIEKREVYAEFGIAAEKAQVLELEAGNVLLAFLTIFIHKDRTVTPEETEVYRAVVNDIDGKTFGALLRLLKKTQNLSDSMIATVDEAIERRNYLMHHFFRTHNFRLFSGDGRNLMLAELKEIEEKLDRAHQILTAVSSILIKISGRDDLDMDLALQMQACGKRIAI